MTMTTDLLNRVSPKIRTDFNFKQSDDKQWLNQGKCPACGKRSLFTHANSPWVLRCGRENKCGVEYNIKNLYPEEFGNYNKRFEATPKNPNAVADAYMKEARGLPLAKIKGFYTQENFYHPKGNHGTATVRFYLPKSDSYMERLVESVEITEDDGSKTIRKQNFKGPHRGLWWQPPGMQINDGDEVWITEAVIDSISLYINGIKSVAILSCSNYPDKALINHKGKNITWVWALDNDKAGKNASKKGVKKMQNDGYRVTAVQVGEKSKKDWNDLHQSQQLSKKDIDSYRYYGSLLIAGDINEKCALIRKRYNAGFFVTDFNNRLYSFNIKDEDYRAALKAVMSRDDGEIRELEPDATDKEILSAIKNAGQTTQIANVRIEFLYFQRNEDIDESLCYARVHFPNNHKAVNFTFTPKQFTSVSEFTTRIAHARGAQFTGSPKHLQMLTKNLIDLKQVEAIDFVGYSKEHRAYIFPNVAVSNGKIYDINDEDYFNLQHVSIKSSFRNYPMKISTTPTKYRKDWAALLYQAFGAKGVICAAYWFATLFAEQTREKDESFPFLEIVGEPGAGKTTLVEFLWRVWGMTKDEEGIDPNKNSNVGNQRKMMQRANIPTVFIEADRSEESHARKYDWNETKPYYNGRGLRVTGAKTTGTETIDRPFRSSLVIEQNASVQSEPAVMERIVSLTFTTSMKTPDSQVAVKKMNELRHEDLSHFVLLATQHEQKILDYTLPRTKMFQKKLEKELTRDRVALCHGRIMAFTEMFCQIAELSKEIKNEALIELNEMAHTRDKVASSDHAVVEEFWEIFNFLNSRPNDITTCALDHSLNPREIAVNLNEFVEMANYAKQQIPQLIELKRHLKSSKQYKFIDASRTVASAIKRTASNAPKPVRCWIFKLPAGVTKVQRADD